MAKDIYRTKIDKRVLAYKKNAIGYGDEETAIVYKYYEGENATIPLGDDKEIRFCYYEAPEKGTGFFLEFEKSAKCYVICDDQKYPINDELPSIDNATLKAMCEADKLSFESLKGNVARDKYGIIILLAQVYYHTLINTNQYSDASEELLQLKSEIKAEEEERKAQLQDKASREVIYGMIVLTTAIIIACLLGGVF